MKYLLILLLLSFPLAARADTYSVLTDESEQSLVEFFAARESRTNVQVVRRMCSVGIASFRSQYVQLTRDTRVQVLKQLNPTDRATVCSIFASYGAPCPVEEP